MQLPEGATKILKSKRGLENVFGSFEVWAFNLVTKVLKLPNLFTELYESTHSSPLALCNLAEGCF